MDVPRVGRYISTAASTLLLYEYAITLPQEIHTVWHRKKITAASLLLVSVRYVMLALAVVQLLHGQKREECISISVITGVLSVISFVQTALFAALRVSALWSSSMIIFTLVAILALLPLTISIYSIVETRYDYEEAPLYACTAVSSKQISHAGSIIAIIAIRTLLVVAAHALILGLTWKKTYKQWRAAKQVRISVPMSGLLLRDGTLYFITLFAINLIQIFTSVFLPQQPFTALATSLPPILVSRFMLNLRQLATYNQSTTSGTAPFGSVSQQSTVNFRVPPRVIGNMGEPLDRDSVGDLDE